MDNETLQSILARHADALNRGEDISEGLLRQYTNGRTAEAARLVELMELARLLKFTLVPLTLRPHVIATMRAELGLDEPTPRAWNRRWIWWGAAVGSMIAGAAGIWVWRRGGFRSSASPI